MTMTHKTPCGFLAILAIISLIALLLSFAASTPGL